MKKINKIITLSFLLCAGLMHITKSNDDLFDEDNFSGVFYTAEDDYLFKEFCNILLNTKIEELKKIMIPGNELAFMNFFTPTNDLVKDLVDEASLFELDYFQSCTYLHILIMLLNSEQLFYLEANYSHHDFKEGRCKILELIKYALEIGVDVNATNLLGYTPLHIAILSSLLQFQIRTNRYGAYEYFNKPLPDWKSIVFINSNVEVVRILLAADADVHIFFDDERGLVDILEFLDGPENEMDQYKKMSDEETLTPEDIECKMIYLSLMPSFEGENADMYNILLEEFAAIKKLIQERI